MPAPDFRGLPPPYPRSGGIRVLNRTYAAFIQLTARTRFAFRSLCFAGCGTVCSCVIGSICPHRIFGGCRPHTPAQTEFGFLIELTPLSFSLLQEHALHSGAHASQGAGLCVRVLSGAYARTGFSGAAAPIPPLEQNSGSESDLPASFHSSLSDKKIPVRFRHWYFFIVTRFFYLSRPSAARSACLPA